MTLNTYLKQIHNYPKLSFEEEQYHVKLAKEGDNKSKEIIINSNLNYVVRIAKQFSKNNNYLEELIQEGNIGLINAFKKFKPELNFRFKTYAEWWIKAYMFSFFEEQNLIKIPQEQKHLLKNIYKIITTDLENNKTHPSYEDIAKKISIEYNKKYNAKDIENILSIQNNLNVFSLNEKKYNDSESELIDFIEDENAEKNIEKILINSTVNNILKKINKLKLDDISKKVFNEWYYEKKEFDQISKELNIKPEKTRQSFDKVKRMLKNSLINDSKYKEYFQDKN
jgi:RNA polymerase primary sigma factor